MDLKEKSCVMLNADSNPLSSDKIVRYKSLLSAGWRVVENQKLTKEFPFENFNRSIAFANDIALIADRENHHPDLHVSYTYVIVDLSTHSIGGLSENDFIMAAKIDEL